MERPPARGVALGRNLSDTKKGLGRDRPMFKIAAALTGTLVVAWLTAASAAEGTPAPAMPPAPAFINIALNVSDIERARAFYVEALGFEDRGKLVPDATMAK